MVRDICENRHGGNAESAEAFRSTPAESRLKLQNAILLIAKASGSYGITTDEVAHRLSAMPNSISGRLSEMKRDWLLVETPHRRQTRMGKMARVLVYSGYVA